MYSDLGIRRHPVAVVGRDESPHRVDQQSFIPIAAFDIGPDLAALTCLGFRGISVCLISLNGVDRLPH